MAVAIEQKETITEDLVAAGQTTQDMQRDEIIETALRNLLDTSSALRSIQVLKQPALQAQTQVDLDLLAIKVITANVTIETQITLMREANQATANLEAEGVATDPVDQDPHILKLKQIDC